VKLYLGLDPGKGGAVAFNPEEGQSWAIKMPENDAELLEELRACAREYDCFAMLEQVASRPGQGVCSVFTFGEGYGKLQMALLACGIPFERVTPGKWQKALGCLTKGDKNVSKKRASELFPHIKITHYNSDALLISEYNKRNRTK